MSFARPSSPIKQDKSEWTVMYYMDSDNNLERPQMENVLAAARAGTVPGVRVIMLVVRSPKSNEDEGYTSMDVLNLKNWVGGKLFEVEKGRLKDLGDWGDVNTTDPANLVKFVDAVTKIAPANKYALIFGDHGASWPGFNSAETHGGNQMPLSQLESALKTITEKIGRLDLIHYDDCLMSCIENMDVVAPYSKYVTASAETVPGDGCDYEAIMHGLDADPSVDGKGFGQIIVDTFRDFYEKSSDPGHRHEAAGITMALIDCDKVKPAVDTMKALGTTLNKTLASGGRDAFIKEARARTKATEYGKGSGDDASVGVVDIVDFCRLLEKQFGPGPLGTAAESTIHAVNGAIVSHIAGKAFPQSRGISIFLPEATDELAGPGNTYEHTRFDAETGWDKVIKAYGASRGADTTHPDLSKIAATGNVLKPGTEITFTSKLKADDLDEAYFTIAVPFGDKRMVLGEIPTPVDGEGNLEEAWDGTWLYLHAGSQTVICPIGDVRALDEDKPDGEVTAVVPMQIKYGGKGEWNDVTVEFLLDFTNEDKITGEIVMAYLEDKDESREIDLDKGDVLRPLFLVVDKDGTEKYLPTKTELTLTEDDGLTIADQRVPAGDFLMGFRAVDLSGNDEEDFVLVTVSNSSPTPRTAQGPLEWWETVAPTRRESIPSLGRR